MDNDRHPSRGELKAILAAVPDEFRLDEISAKAGVREELLERLIDSDPEFFRDGARVSRRERVFNGRKFLITPEAWEIEAGILVPGHRFVPYVDPEVFPSETVLRLGRRKAASREDAFRLARVIGCFPLLGSEQMIDVLAAESPSNGFLRSGVRGDSEVRLTVFDLSAFYREHDFEEGDALLCEVADYRGGVVKAGFLSGAKRSAARKKDFISALDAACEETLGRFDDYLDIPEVLAWSFFLGGSLLDSPGASLDEFIRESLRIVLASASDGRSELRLAARGDEEESGPEALPEGLTISSGETGSIPAMLKTTGVAVTPEELDGFILDACATRELDFAACFARAFRGVGPDFADAAQEAIFMNAVEERFEELSGHYDRVDDELKAPLRSSVMEAVEERLDFLSEAAALERGVEQLEHEKMHRLALVAGKLGSMLKMLNREDFMPDAVEVERLEAQLESLLDEQDAALEALRKILSSDR